MKKLFTLAIFSIFFLGLASASVLILEQPDDLYVAGETLEIPIKVTSSIDATYKLKMILLCNGRESEILERFVSFDAGEEKTFTESAPLIKSTIGNSAGSCKVKTSLGDESVFTDEFTISDVINVELQHIVESVEPGDKILIEGDATNTNGNPVDGYVELTIKNEDSTVVEISDTVRGGYFHISFTLSKTVKAGESILKVRVYEIDDYEGEITNEGYIDSNLEVAQIPTTLDIELEKEGVVPGDVLQVRAVLRDQTGGKIPELAIITFKDHNNKILEQFDVDTDEMIEFPIPPGALPDEWKVIAFSNKLSQEAIFTILEHKEVQLDFVNDSVIVTNIGNVLYNNSVSVKIGDQSIPIELYLEVGNSEKYLITAPEGEYEVEVTPFGENGITHSVFLTGSVISVRKASEGIIYILRHPISWIFAISVLAFIAFMLFRKGYKKSFIGRVISKPKTKIEETKPVFPIQKETGVKSNLPAPKNSPNGSISFPNEAVMSLSMKGAKQTSNVVCLSIKNYDEVRKNIQGIEETMKKVSKITADKNIFVYQSNSYLFFILSPETTKTFKNEKTSVDFSEMLRELLDKHNKLFKQKIDYGISLNSGEIISGIVNDKLHFSSIGVLIPLAKKVSNNSSKEILLTQEFKNKVTADIKTERVEKEDSVYYKLVEVKNKEDHSKFIDDFVNRNFKKH